MSEKFIHAALVNLDERLAKACGLWAALILAKHSHAPLASIVGLELAIHSFESHCPSSLRLALSAAHDEDTPSGVRSAIYALDAHNWKLHVAHSLIQCARHYGYSLVVNTILDTVESLESPLAS